MPLDNKKIFLAGSTGMAGTGILRYLTENVPNVEIRASYHKIAPFIKNRQIDYVRGDLRSLDDARRMAAGCGSAIMAASFTGGAGFTKSFPWEHMKENLLMNLQMLEAFRLENIKRIIFIGSAVLYQEFEGSIKEESLDLNKEPHDSYFAFSWGVRFTEKLCEFLYKKYGIEVILLRLANIFGPYDKFNPETSNFIPAIIRKAVDKMNPFEVWGSPQVTRDVLYVDDFSRAVVDILDRDEIKFGVFNLGSGLRVTVDEVVRLSLKYAGHNPSEIRYAQDKPTTIKFRSLDCNKIKKALSWEPKYSVAEGIRQTTEWWQENKDSWVK